jgi:D-methionine transport system ATP-binding protein
MIKLNHINVTFNKGNDKLEAIKDVSLHIKQGDIFGIVGGSGAGKSTLVRTINGLQKPTAGEVIVDGQDITKLGIKELREVRRKIGMIFQHFNLISRKTVGENIEFALKVQGISKKERKSKTRELLDLVGLNDKENVYPFELSGGQKQRVGIARALATNPKILLCDEATSALDAQTTKEIVEILRNINKKFKITVVFITHQLEVAKQLFNNIAVINSGEIVEQNNAYNIFANPQHQITKKLVSTETIIPEIVTSKVKGRILSLIYKGETSIDPVISNASKRYGVDINILHGNIEYIQEQPIGVLVISINGPQKEVDKATVYLYTNIEDVDNFKQKEVI